MSDLDLVELLGRINRKPEAALLKALGDELERNSGAWDIEAGPTRFDVDRRGRLRKGYGFSSQVEREPIYELYFCVADLVREGFLPEYRKKLWGLFAGHLEWFGR